MERGQDYGVALAGYFAMRSLRVEKFYAFWGQDLGTTTTPLECGRGFRVKFNVSGGSIGRTAAVGAVPTVTGVGGADRMSSEAVFQ